METHKLLTEPGDATSALTNSTKAFGNGVLQQQNHPLTPVAPNRSLVCFKYALFFVFFNGILFPRYCIGLLWSSRYFPKMGSFQEGIHPYFRPFVASIPMSKLAKSCVELLFLPTFRSVIFSFKEKTSHFS